MLGMDLRTTSCSFNMRLNIYIYIYIYIKNENLILTGNDVPRA